MRHCKDCNIKISSGSKTGFCRSCSKKYSPIWNKGLTKQDAPQMGNSGAKQGAIPHNKNKLMPLEQKIKLSCTNSDIEVKDFIEFSMPESKRIRGKFDDSDLKKTCFEKALYKCDICNLGGKLNAHHLDGWNWCIEKRFELDNLVCLCQSCHKEFHSLFGSKNNTKQQYIEFKKGQINWPSN